MSTFSVLKLFIDFWAVFLSWRKLTTSNLLGKLRFKTIDETEIRLNHRPMRNLKNEIQPTSDCAVEHVIVVIGFKL